MFLDRVAGGEGIYFNDFFWIEFEAVRCDFQGIYHAVEFSAAGIRFEADRMDLQRCAVCATQMLWFYVLRVQMIKAERPFEWFCGRCDAQRRQVGG